LPKRAAAAAARAAADDGSGERPGLARASGVTELLLLTETAESWFARLGYQVIDRASVPADVARSVEFVTACADTAVAMRRRLD
jgi:amino-acid N-acetyltransferase